MQLPVNLHLLTVQSNPFQEGMMIFRLDHSFAGLHDLD